MGALISLICSVQRCFTSSLLPDAPGMALHICHMLPALQKTVIECLRRAFSLVDLNADGPCMTYHVCWCSYMLSL